MPRLFVGLDGELADFDAGAAAALGMSCQDYQDLHGAPVMWKALEATAEFYNLLPWTSDGRDLWGGITEPGTWSGPPPMILSGLPLGGWAQTQKREWCARELGMGVPVLLCLPQDKAQFCVAGDILIDHWPATGRDWVAAGGQFIHHTSAVESLAALRQLVHPQP